MDYEKKLDELHKQSLDKNCTTDGVAAVNAVNKLRSEVEGDLPLKALLAIRDHLSKHCPLVYSNLKGE